MSDKELIKQTLHLIDNWLDYQTYIKEIPGVAVGIFVEDEVIFKKVYGYANLEKKEKLTDQHLFRIASHSKLFTATAIMKLYNEDKLSLDDRIVKHLPWFTSEKDENTKQIRIRHLLTHSSGMTRDGITGHWIKHEFPTIEKIKAQVKEGITFFETSETLKYSNFGYTILGQIIEAVSGLSYSDYIQKEILDPLEMKNTFVDVDESNLSRHATGHRNRFPRKDRETFNHVPARVMHAATGLSSNVEDLIKFYKAHFYGNNILFPDYIKREMQRVQFKEKKGDRGLGFGMLKLPDKPDKDSLVGHSGGYPGFITRSGLNQDKKLILVVLTNASDGPATDLALGILKIFAKVKDDKQKFKLKPKEIKPDFSSIVGFYEANGWVSLFSQIGSKLVVIGPKDTFPSDFMQIYKHDKDFRFIAPKDLPFSSPGQPVEFIDGPDGQKIFVDAHRAEHKKFKYEY
jgi:CubicO group peptidase (beta-lactamase class C family)